MISLTSNESDKIVQDADGVFGDWLRCEAPSETDKSFIAGWGVDPGILTDALDPHEVPRLDNEAGWIYFLTRVAEPNQEFNDFTTPVLFAISSDKYLTISRANLSKLWQPFIKSTTASTSQSGRLFLLMIDYIARDYQSRVADINRQVRSITDSVSSLRAKEIATMVSYERQLNDYLDALVPTNIALDKLLVGDSLSFAGDDKGEVEDLLVDFEQVITRCRSLLRTIQNLRDSYRAVMDTRLNETMRLLTIITVVLTIPTMIAGMLGMNVKLPFEAESGLVFWQVAGVSVLSAMILGYYFSKR